MFLALPLFSQNLVFNPSDTEITSDPRSFLELVKVVYEENHKATGKYPATWDSVIPLLEKKLRPHEHMSKDLYNSSGTILKVLYPRDTRYLNFLYIINITKSGYTVHSENVRKEQNWIISSEESEPWWWFASTNEELVKIGEKQYYLSGDASFIPGSKDRRRDRQLIVWKFYHPRAFDILFKYIANPREDYNFRINAAKAIIQMPAPGRFKTRIPEIDRIIKTETSIKNWDEDWRRKSLVELLRVLRINCQGKDINNRIK